ncbi:MAG: hypothetical protein KIT17_19880 [Rubrivivax sp.]|nr:hypothetical protein [Rubrivivax sp.]
MSDHPWMEQYRLGELSRLHDEARQQALRLRREAMDDFWRGANGLLGGAALAAQRAAQRLAYRLQRRGVRRPALPAACP